jgi:hypothetical protein
MAWTGATTSSRGNRNRRIPAHANDRLGGIPPPFPGMDSSITFQHHVYTIFYKFQAFLAYPLLYSGTGALPFTLESPITQ